MRYRITEWNVVRQCYASWEGTFANDAEAYSAIEYFGHFERLAEEACNSPVNRVGLEGVLVPSSSERHSNVSENAERDHRV